MRIRVIVVATLLGAVCARPALAQRIAITPFVGWETAGSYPLTDATMTQPAGDIQELRADAGKVFGAAVDVPVTTNLQAEFMWTDNSTNYSALSLSTGTYSTAFKSRIDQYQFGVQYLLGDSATALRPYLVASLGFTHDSNYGASPNRTALGFGAGGGIQYALSSHFGIRSEARWMPTYGSAGLGTFCDYGGGGLDYGYDPYYGGGCYQDTVRNYLQRFNFTVGITIRP